ncbi:MAG: hypothetical protein AAF405_00600, partial [Pseudomonadota bacterium]
IDNLISAVAHVLTTEQTRNDTYLVADPAKISVAELVSAMREGLGRPPQLVKVPLGAVKRVMTSFGREADFERICSSFEIDAGKLKGTGWQPRVESHEGIVAMMRDA